MSIQKQIEYLKKIKDKSITKQELCDYLTMIVEDNFVQMPTVPKVEFAYEKTCNGSYNENVVNINLRNINNIIEFFDIYDIVSILNTVGHECRHHWQENCGLTEYVQTHKSEYYEKLNKTVFQEGRELSISGTLKAVRNFYLHSSSKDFIELESVPHLNKWIKSIDDQTIFKLEKNIERSHYLQLAHEEDARFGGIIWTSLLYNEYQRYCEKTGDTEMAEYVHRLRRCSMQIMKEYNENLKEYKSYKEFKEAFKDVSYEVLKDFNTILSREDLDKYEVAMYSALLDMYAKEYVERLYPEEAEIIFIEHSNSIFNTEKTEEQNRLSKLLLEKIVNSSLTEEKKCQFAALIYYNYLENVESHKFSEKDFVLTYLYANGFLSSEAYFSLVNLLFDSGKADEAIELLKTRKMNNKDNVYSCADEEMMKCMGLRWDILLVKADEYRKNGLSEEEKDKYSTQLKEFYNEYKTFIDWYEQNDNKTKEEIEQLIKKHCGFKVEELDLVINEFDLPIDIRENDKKIKRIEAKDFFKLFITEEDRENKQEK